MAKMLKGRRSGSLAFVPSNRMMAGMAELDGGKGDVALPFGMMNESAEKLLVDLNNRVRQLVADLRAEEEKRLTMGKSSDARMNQVKKDMQTIQQKYDAERDAHAITQEELRKRDESIAILKDGIQEYKDREKQAEEINKRGWDTVCVKNFQLQHLRRRDKKLRSSNDTLKKSKAKAAKQRDSAMARLHPLQQKNIELEYRLGLQLESAGTKDEKIKELSEEVSKCRLLLHRFEQRNTQIGNQMTRSMELSSRQDLEMHELQTNNHQLSIELDATRRKLKGTVHALEQTEEALDNLQAEWDRLHGDHEEAQEVLEQTENQLREFQADNSALTATVQTLNDSLHYESTEREALEGHCTSLRNELDDIKAHSPLLDGITYTKKVKANLRAQKVKKELEYAAALEGEELVLPARHISTKVALGGLA